MTVEQEVGRVQQAAPGHSRAEPVVSALRASVPSRGAYYNENDPFAAQWLRNLIAAGHIAPGHVDERDIRDVRAAELAGYRQCHFFAGIGVWSYALRQAGWSDDRAVWTGSCPCQPFSAAGKQQGFDDARHLWPVWFDLIRECGPAIVLGEQVAGALDWLDLVSADLEGADYAFGAADTCAAGFGGAHIRQRLYFVGLADPSGQGKGRGRILGPGESGSEGLGAARKRPQGLCAASRLADTDGRNASKERQQRGREHGREPQDGGAVRSGDRGAWHTEPDRRVADADRWQRDRLASGEGCEPDWQAAGRQQGDGGAPGDCELGRANAPLLGRNAADWLYCRDGKWRPVEPGTFPLADAAPARVGRLRAYGNGLDAETAAQFVGAVIEAIAPLEQAA